VVGMFIKSDIRKVAIALEKRFYREVYLELGREGIIQLSSPDGGMTEKMGAGLRDEEIMTREILSESEFVMNALSIVPADPGMPDTFRDIVQDAEFVSKTRKTVERLQRVQSRIREAFSDIGECIASLEALAGMGINPASIRAARIVRVIFGTVENADWEALAGEGFMLAKSGRYVFGAALPSDVSLMLQMLDGYGFRDRSGDLRDEPVEKLRRRRETLGRRMEVLEEYSRRLRDKEGQKLADLHGIYAAYAEVIKAMRMSVFSARAMFITGWMDMKERKTLADLLHRVCGDRYVVTYQRDPDAPVRLMNIRLLKPFELLVKTMGMPANREMDPTPLTAVTFVPMFGLMFGDLGQGLVLALCGSIMKRIAGKKAREGLGQAGGILVACGLSAAVCGLLYGSFFSSEHVIPALWFHPAEHIMSLFSVTILMGAVFIMTGLSINIMNSLANSDYTEAFLEKRGLAVLILYTAAVYFAVRLVVAGRIPAPWEAYLFILLPLAVFSLRGVLGPFLFHEHKPLSITEYVIETLVEILEIALSMFANTISFIRVGAFALSHAGLSIVTYTLAGMADPAMKSSAAILIIAAGNVFIIGFEGLICGIQSMRLEYYEFFSKFFQGDGVAFTPFMLKGKASEV